jgi:nucleotide-binding universal stress UspA family protein
MSGVVIGMSRTAPRSSAPLRWASETAAMRGLPLTLVHSWDAPVSVSVKLAAGHWPDLTGPATALASCDRASTALLAERPDVLVLGRPSDGRHLSHVAAACLKEADCPVVIVPHDALPGTRRVVVGICGTEASLAALRWAAEEAALRMATLVIVYVWQWGRPNAKSLLRPGQAFAHQQHAAIDQLDEWVGAELTTTAVELRASHGGPLDELMQVSAAADLIVLGRGAHVGPARILRGSLGADLSNVVQCPVAIVPGPPA